MDWFRRCKVPDGKPENEFAFNAEFKDKNFAIDIIESTRDYWRALVTKKTDGKGISCMNTMVSGSPFQCDPDAAKAIVDALPPPCESACIIPTNVDSGSITGKTKEISLEYKLILMYPACQKVLDVKVVAFPSFKFIELISQILLSPIQYIHTLSI